MLARSALPAVPPLSAWPVDTVTATLDVSIAGVACAETRKVADPRARNCDLFDDGVEELGEYEMGAGSRRSRYDHDPSRVDGVLSQFEASSGGKFHAFSDALGSIYGLSEASGTVASRYSYDVFGRRLLWCGVLTTISGVRRSPMLQ
jgi:hypothetical protein